MKIPSVVIDTLNKLVGAENVLTDKASLLLHGYDCSLSRTQPDAVVCIPSSDKIAPVISLFNQYQIPFIPRASATNHAGSCAPLRGGVVLNLTALNRILQIDTQHHFAWVEPGVITAQLQDALEPLGFFYAPDPASERVCTLGGNLAQNASGARCMKYGGTLDHVLAAEIVLPSGEKMLLSRQDFGPDLLGLFIGSEGTLGIATKIQVKILPIPPHIQTFLVTFPSLESCVQTVSDLAAQGIIPRCVEAMDRVTMETVKEFMQVDFSAKAEALLILELDGNQDEIQSQQLSLKKICQKNQALSFSPAATAQQRATIWRGRKAAYAAMARLAPNVMVGDGTVPRSELPRALHKVRQILQENQVYAGLLFHAGDGNFHPHLIFNEHNRPETKRISQTLRQILQACVDCNGTISGEHGIGVEKRALMAYQYDVETLDLFAKIKQATDPKDIANPLKIIPLNYQEKARAASRPDLPYVEAFKHFIENRKPFVIVGTNSVCKSTNPNQLSSITLNRILEIDLQNYTVTAQAGVSLRALQAALSARKAYHTLPAENGTLGGAFSSGQYPHFYSQVTGLAALLPDGSYVRYGGKLTKNAAGYNLIRLFAGAQGAFGMVTELTFKIYATPQPIPHAKPFQKASLNTWALALAKAVDPHRLINKETV